MSLTHLLPPGKYFIGDPGFVLSDETWEVVLRMTNFFKTDEPVELCGHHLWGGAVNHGNPYCASTFSDQNDVQYSVNDNVLAAVSIELIENPEGEDHGTMIDAPNGLTVNFSNGTFRFNDIVINTNDDQIKIDDGGYDLDPDDDYFI